MHKAVLLAIAPMALRPALGASTSTSVTTTECRLRDIQTIMGGRSYNVHNMRGIQMVHYERHALVVFGSVEIVGKP